VLGRGAQGSPGDIPLGSLKEFGRSNSHGEGLTWGEIWRASPKYQVLRREREKCGTQPPEGTSSPRGGPQSLVGNPVPGTRASCDLALGFSRKWERDHSSAYEEDSPKAGGGWWLEVGWGGGTSLWASERVALSRIWGPGKAAQIPEESRESKVSAGNSTRSRVSAPNVKKRAALKESSQEKSHVHRAKFNGKPKLPGWPRKRSHRS
jgi:hypothetical protein